MVEKKTERWPAGPIDLERQENELIIEIEAERLKDFHNHPFRIKEDIEMKELMESIGRFGILSPLVVRPLPEGKYEIVSGHRRKYAALMLGYRKLPVIIRVMDDDEAVISMVEANIHRETILPTEKAFAIKMKYDALKRAEGKKKRSQNDHRPKGVRTVQLLGEETGDSAKQIQRYLKITELIPELRDLLDAASISFNPAYGKKNLNPQMVDSGAEKMITVPDGVDAETLMKVLGNPEMVALLSSLAKTLNDK